MVLKLSQGPIRPNEKEMLAWKETNTDKWVLLYYIGLINPFCSSAAVRLNLRRAECPVFSFG